VPSFPIGVLNCAETRNPNIVSAVVSPMKKNIQTVLITAFAAFGKILYAISFSSGTKNR